MAFGAKHIREVFPGHLVDLRARSGPVCFREFVGRFIPVGMISCPNDTLSPVVIITSDAVQVDLILQKFITVSSRMWSSMLVTTTGFVMLGVMRWKRFL